MARCVFVLASLILFVALIAVGIAFFGPNWLANVDINERSDNESYFLYPYATGSRHVSSGGEWIYVRGLWAECGLRCQWFWENNSVLQKMLFTPLAWHLAAQVLYIVGFVFVLLSVVFVNVQMCCYERAIVFRVLGAILLVSVCLQTAAIAVFGGGAAKTYGARANVVVLSVDWTTTDDVFFDWCYWMAVAGDGFTLVSGVLFLVHDCVLIRRNNGRKK